jgi:hypothetical protein
VIGEKLFEVFGYERVSQPPKTGSSEANIEDEVNQPTG